MAAHPIAPSLSRHSGRFLARGLVVCLVFVLVFVSGCVREPGVPIGELGARADQIGNSLRAVVADVPRFEVDLHGLDAIIRQQRRPHRIVHIDRRPWDQEEIALLAEESPPGMTIPLNDIAQSWPRGSRATRTGESVDWQHWHWALHITVADEERLRPLAMEWADLLESQGWEVTQAGTRGRTFNRPTWRLTLDDLGGTWRIEIAYFMRWNAVESSPSEPILLVEITSPETNNVR